MNTLQALVLGIVQGLTEFLPVSSSGHLVIMQHYLGFREPLLLFDVMLHAATLAAVIIYFRQDLWKMLLSFRLKKKTPEEISHRKMFYFIFLGTIPTAVLGIFFNSWILKSWLKFFFVSIVFTSFMLLFTGILLWVSERKERPEGKESLEKEDPGKGIREMRATDALLIGIMQGIAIIPGISRSGATISTGLLRGIKKELAFRYSFLLSIPAIIGALGLQLREAFLEKNLPSRLLPWAGAALSAAVIGYLSLILLQKAVIKKRLSIFAYYCWIVGIVSLIIQAWGR